MLVCFSLSAYQLSAYQIFHLFFSRVYSIELYESWETSEDPVWRMRRSSNTDGIYRWGFYRSYGCCWRRGGYFGEENPLNKCLSFFSCFELFLLMLHIELTLNLNPTLTLILHIKLTLTLNPTLTLILHLTLIQRT